MKVINPRNETNKSNETFYMLKDLLTTIQEEEMKRICVIWLCIMLTFGSTFLFIDVSEDTEGKTVINNDIEYITRTPIRINSNADFDAAHGVTGGIGTPSEPYIIENYEINGTGYGNCIYIGNTSSHFVLRNSRLHHAIGGLGIYFSNSGLFLQNVTNGTIFNNSIFDNSNGGIRLENSSSNQLFHNNIIVNENYQAYDDSSNSWDNGYGYGDIITYQTINPHLTTSPTGWKKYGWCRNTNDAEQYWTNTGGNPGGALALKLIHGDDDSVYDLGGYWEQSCNVSRPISAYLSFDWTLSENEFFGTGVPFDFYVFIDAYSGTPSMGTEVWSQSAIDITPWTSVGPINISSDIDVTDRYFLKLAMRATLAWGGYAVGLFDNVQITWNEYNDGGNYWGNNYTGNDFNSTPLQNVPPPDGIGDTPYFIDGDSQDNFPLIEPWKFQNDHSIWVEPPSYNITVPAGQIHQEYLTVRNNGHVGNIYFNIEYEESIKPCAYWKLDETSGTIAYNSIMPGKHGNTMGGPDMNQLEMINTSFWFDSFDLIKMMPHDNHDFSVGEDFSIFAWVKTHHAGHILGKTDATGLGYLMKIYDNGTIRAYTKNVNGTVASVWGGNNLTDGEWHYVGMSRCGSTLEAFVDFKSVGTNDSAAGNLANNDMLYIGVARWGTAFLGYIDDVRVYNKSVHPSEVYTTLPPSSEIDINITFNATNLNPGFYQSNIRITSNDPINDLIVIPVDLIVLPALHDIRIRDMTVEGDFEAGKSLWINGTILNQGLVNETNVDIQLFVDFGLEDFITFSTLNISEERIAQFEWIPTFGGQHTLSLYAIPVPSEIVIFNNWWNETVNIAAYPDIWVTPLSFDFVIKAGQTNSTNLTIGNADFGDLNYSISSIEPPEDIFNDDFDGETEGTSPENWVNDGSKPGYTFEVDDVQSYSGPHSLWLKAPSDSYAFCHHDIIEGWANQVSIMIYFSDTGMYTYLCTQNSTGNFDGSQILAYVGFRGDGTIRYYDGNSWVNTGKTYDVGWHKIDIVMDVENDLFDLWYDGVKIVTEGILMNSGDMVRSLQLGVSQVGSVRELWFDDITIGENVDWLSVLPDYGGLPIGSNSTHTVAVNATNLNPGFYQSNITITSNDPVNDSIIIPVNLTVKTETYNISVNEGWNLISTPLIPIDESIAQVLSSIDGKWDYIQTYDNINDIWKTNATFKPDQLNDLDTLNHKIGFWINITEPGVTLTVGGYIPTSTTISLYAGWNLVGYPSLNTESVGNALWGTGADRVMVCDPAEPYRIKEVGATYLMNPGEGYWVHVPADTIWIIDW